MNASGLTEAEYKSERLVDLLERFRSGARLTAPQVADHYGCSLRTAHRLLLSLAKVAPLTYRERYGPGEPRRTWWLVKR